MGNDTHLFSMDIDDVFSIPGRGTVATGKITVGYIYASHRYWTEMSEGIFSRLTQ